MICICVRNGQDWIDRCFSALLPEARECGFKIRVVDHLSTDATSSMLRRWAEGEGAGWMEVERFDGRGLAAARNRAWKGANSKWVAFVDIDCRVHPGWGKELKRAVELIETDPTIGSVGGANTVPEGEHRLRRAQNLMLASYVGGHSSIQNRGFSEEMEVDHTPTLNVVFRRAALEAVGGFDERFERVGEDIDLTARLRKAKYRLWYLPTLRVEHGLRPDLGGWVRNMLLYGRGRMMFLRAHPDEFHLKYLVPSAAVFGYLALIPFGLLWVALVGAHWFVLAAGMFPAFLKTRASFGNLLFAVYVLWLTHLTYGIGFIAEAVYPSVGRKEA